VANERDLLQEIEGDLRLSTRSPASVLYLEGKTDPEMLFALLGEPVPPGNSGRGVLHGGVLVKGLEAEGKMGRPPGSGSARVRRLVELAQREGYPGVFGVLDGDGRPLRELAPLFDAPCAGPLFSWKAYCLENLVARAAWPLAWGPAPDWTTALEVYAPYVALNKIHGEMTKALATLQLAKHNNPHHNWPRLDELAVLDALKRDKHLVAGYDVARVFEEQTREFKDTLGRSEEEAHALLNGKWLLNDFAPRSAGKSSTPDLCRAGWLEAVRGSGGFEPVRGFWKRMFP